MNRNKVKEVYDDYIVDIDGWKYYYKDNFVYSRITNFGNIYYYNELGQYHRNDGPAIEYASGDKEYWIDGVRTTKL